MLEAQPEIPQLPFPASPQAEQLAHDLDSNGDADHDGEDRPEIIIQA